MEPIWAPGREKSNRFGSYCRLSKTLPFYQSSWAVKYSGDIISITTWHQQWFSGIHAQAVEMGVGEGASSSWSLALFAPTPSKHLPAQTSWLGCRVGAWETAHFLKPPEAGSYQLPVGSDHTETTYRQLGFKKAVFQWNLNQANSFENAPGVFYCWESGHRNVPIFTRNALGIEVLDKYHESLPANTLDKDQITVINIHTIRKITFQPVLWHLQLTSLW